MGTAHLYIDDAAIESGRRSGLLTFADGSALTLWYEVDGVALSAASGADPFVLGTWLLWMKRGGSFHIHGSVSRRLLSGLTEFQDAWMRWRAGQILPVDVTADHVRGDSVRNPKAVVAFSGGWMLRLTLPRLMAMPVAPSSRAARVMHGFGIHARRTRHIRQNAPQSAPKRMLQGSGVELITVRTNSGTLPEKWYDVIRSRPCVVLCPAGPRIRRRPHHQQRLLQHHRLPGWLESGDRPAHVHRRHGSPVGRRRHEPNGQGGLSGHVGPGHAAVAGLLEGPGRRRQLRAM